ncbi:MAG TPA: SDR family oxidoreductase [Sneathiellales bacterium]|nr:SDR family oxidoreductase [Sneathiellales bacterium]
MSSIAARIGGVFGGAYATSKAGTDGLMHHYANNLKEFGVISNAISAALIETDIFDGVKLPPVENMPTGRMGRPEEIGMVAQMMAAICLEFIEVFVFTKKKQKLSYFLRSLGRPFTRPLFRGCGCDR